MTLIINNHDVQQVLTMEDTIAALEQSYLQLASQEAVCRPRIDIRIPTGDPARNYQWGTMEGGSTAGYFAIRMKSDVIYETEYNGVITQEKYCMRPGLYCGLILLTSIQNGEPLAFINDGYLQHMPWARTAASALNTWRTKVRRWSVCSVPAGWRARTWRLSRACARSRSSRYSAPREKTESDSGAKWQRNTISR